MSRAADSLDTLPCSGSDGCPIFDVLQSWGVASARHTSGCIVYPYSSANPSDDDGRKKANCFSPSQEQMAVSCVDMEYLFDVPIGPSIVRWDFQGKSRVLQFQAHCDVVTCMRMSPDRSCIATSCFSGEVKLWNPQWACLDHMTAPMTSQHHLAWSHDSRRFLIVGNGRNSSVVVYDVIFGDSDVDKIAPQLREAWRVRAGQHFDSTENLAHGDHDGAACVSTRENQYQAKGDEKIPTRVDHKDSGLEYQYGDAFYMAEINPSGNVFAVEERPERSTLARLYSPSGELLNTSKLCLPIAQDSIPAAADDKESSSAAASGRKSAALRTLLISTYKEGRYTLVVQGGYVLFVDAEQLAVTNSFKVGYSCRTCVWDGDSLILPSDSGKLTWWSQTGDELTSFSVGTSDYVVRLDWSVSGRALWMCGFSTMTCLEVTRNDKGSVESVSPRYTITSHSIACCGAGFSPNGRSLASGDLAGNVWVTEQQNYQPKHTFTVSTSVRCIAWKADTVMLIGCLDGCVHQWEEGGATKELLHLEGSVLHMQFDQQLKLLAVGTSKGVLSVYDTTSKESDNFKTVTSFIAHPPQPGPQNPRFGQLGLQAEIWSLCWSPNDIMIATSSEDQTTKIWNATEWTCTATLRGHSMAVTSVDWKTVGQQSIIATCADDRTVRLTCGESFELIRILNTKDIYGWHTLTYLAFQRTGDSPLLVCSTQNGHIVVWDGLTGQRLARGKIHLGSIEGLALQSGGNCLATVGADCVVNMFKIKL